MVAWQIPASFGTALEPVVNGLGMLALGLHMLMFVFSAGRKQFAVHPLYSRSEGLGEWREKAAGRSALRFRGSCGRSGRRQREKKDFVLFDDRSDTERHFSDSYGLVGAVTRVVLP